MDIFDRLGVIMLILLVIAVVFRVPALFWLIGIILIIAVVILIWKDRHEQ